ncbi:head-tail connector protein [Rhodomicrobium lacus]|uniref:head-tail connector protein n=1 Tax=Rhodomicrobium lacus TaxID=2498452 RepID=UPI000F8F0762|nr:phage head-tail connector protein [Rhodomicrobium lacus]
MYLVRTQAPTGQILTVADAKAQLRITIDDEDALLADYVQLATEYLEGFNGRGGYLGRALLTQSFEYRVHAFPECGAALCLPMPPLQSVTSVKYLDAAGTLQTLDPEAYAVETACLQGHILPVTRWPGTAAHPHAVRVAFVAGYGDTPAQIPLGIRQAAKLIVGMHYVNREAGNDLKGGFGFACDALLSQHRISGF